MATQNDDTTVTTTTDRALKYDEHKLRMDLIPPCSLAEVARVYTYGARKYGAHNWRKGLEWSRVYAALQRHLNAFWAGEDIDSESHIPHLAHAAFGCLTLLNYMEHQREFDDREDGDK